MLVASPDKRIQHGSKEVFGGIVSGPANALGQTSWRVSGAPILGALSERLRQATKSDSAWPTVRTDTNPPKD